MHREESSTSWSRQIARGVADVLYLLGGLALLAALLYAGYVALLNWAIQQDRFLVSSEIALFSVPTITPTATPSPTPTPLPTPTITPSPTTPPKPIQIGIPAIGVESSIVRVPLTTNERTGVTDWAIDSLFRPGRKDLVGHLEGTSLPGEPGNSVLGGHNWGVGYPGIFVHLGRLKRGDQITVVNETGATLLYEVVSVERVKVQRGSVANLARHLDYLAPAGEERLTLMSCAGADFEPFPERVYVVARPVR